MIEHKKTVKNALDKVMNDHRALKEKQEQKLWRNLSPSMSFHALLEQLTKVELDYIRRGLKITGVSSLKKADLIDELVERIPNRINKFIDVIDQDRLQIIDILIEYEGIIEMEDRLPLKKIDTLRRYGVVFPGMINEKKVLIMPQELMDRLKSYDRKDIELKAKRNEEWIRLTQGMLYYYGVLKINNLVERVKSMTSFDFDAGDYFSVIHSASSYYEHIAWDRSFFIDTRVYDVDGLIHQQNSRSTIDYYPFTRKQLLAAGVENYLDITAPMMQLIRYMKNTFHLTEHEINEHIDKLITITNTSAKPTSGLNYLQTQFTFDDVESFKQLAELVMAAQNGTRQWQLKGYMPSEISPLSSRRPPKRSTKNNVVQLNTAKKVGRNAPCPCGSGKKHKKCCGK